MPSSRYLHISIDDRPIDLESAEELPLAISYKLEDPENFQNKKSTESFNLKVPATLNNDRVANTFHDPAVEDLTEGSVFRSHRSALIEANSMELLIGKAFLVNARHHSCPLDYEFNFYGNNGDWIIDLKEATLYDFLKHINFTFTKQAIIDSWDFDGTDEALPYVFAPVRYSQPMDTVYITDTVISGIPPTPHEVVVGELTDYNMKPEYMRPALSKYWLLYWGYKSLGYRIASDFFDTEYFRRQVMPWTWGNFLFSDGTRLNNLDFLAKSVEEVSMINQDITTFWDLEVSNESINGAFDNNGVYQWDDVNKEGKWTYLPAFDYGTLEATFHAAYAVRATATANSDVELRIQWFKNGVKQDSGTGTDNGNGTLLMELNAPTVGRRDFAGVCEDWFTTNVSPGDVISFKTYLHTFDSGTGIARIHASVDAFELDYFRIPIGGQINFENYLGLKKWKFLDFVRGVIDEFNLAVATDPINKVVYFEPSHPYSLEEDQSVKTGGYFNGNFLDWEEKQDVSEDKISELSLFSDSERELIFKYKDDSNDGALKKVQDRYLTTLAAGKYVLPDRFKSGKRDIENRFFSATMHYNVDQWRNITGTSPQMICMVPENIANTSHEEAQNIFGPKSAYYKGIIADVGWVFDGDEQTEFPFLFAVNYMAGGESDPVLSYSDERIGPLAGSSSGDDYTLGIGLLRRFYLQRMANMRNGQDYTTWFKLNNFDITNWLHREHIVCRGQKWELCEIREYKPLKEETTEVYMRKWEPVRQADGDAVYPSQEVVLDTGDPTSSFDTQYAQLKCLPSDIPK